MRFLAENKRPRLSNSRSSDDHENTIEEDVTDENWEGFEANFDLLSFTIQLACRNGKTWIDDFFRIGTSYARY